jgi:hypothetical protein
MALSIRSEPAVLLKCMRRPNYPQTQFSRSSLHLEKYFPKQTPLETEMHSGRLDPTDRCRFRCRSFQWNLQTPFPAVAPSFLRRRVRAAAGRASESPGRPGMMRCGRDDCHGTQARWSAPGPKTRTDPRANYDHHDSLLSGRFTSTIMIPPLPTLS